MFHRLWSRLCFLWSGCRRTTRFCLAVFCLLLIKALLLSGSFLVSPKKEAEKPNRHTLWSIHETETSGSEKETSQAVSSQADSSSDAGGVSNPVLSYQTKRPRIRVLITGANARKIHTDIRFTASAPFQITFAGGSSRFEAGEPVSIRDFFQQKKIQTGQLSLLDDSEGFLFTDLKQGTSACYPGSFSVFQAKDGYYLIHSVPIETYLPGVVSSEMPDRFGLEALKAQAVCARSYAYAALEQCHQAKTKAGTISWHVEDSTSDQVYLSSVVKEKARTACQETADQVIGIQEQIQKPHYYSTSWGQRADGGVFSNKGSVVVKAFAAKKTSRKQTEAANRSFLQQFQAFEIPADTRKLPFSAKGQETTDTVLDQKSPWFRWSCTLSAGQFSRNGLQDIAVTDRGKGGYAKELELSYQDGSIQRISGSSAIRHFLGNTEMVYRLWDESQRSGLSILPSAFFYLEKKDSDSAEPVFSLHGGGYGHGCGMSQYGAAELADRGASCQQILHYYFPSMTVYTLQFPAS